MRRLVICSTCKFSVESKFAPDGRTGGQVMIDSMNAVLESEGRNDVIVETQSCLWNCTRPCSVVIQDDQRYSYITGGNQPTLEQARAILEWFDAHGKSDMGEVAFKLWPQLMRGHFIARIPPVKA